MVTFGYSVNSEREAEPRTPANTLLVGGTSSAFSATSHCRARQSSHARVAKLSRGERSQGSTRADRAASPWQWREGTPPSPAAATPPSGCRNARPRAAGSGRSAKGGRSHVSRCASHPRATSVRGSRHWSSASWVGRCSKDGRTGPQGPKASHYEAANPESDGRAPASSHDR